MSIEAMKQALEALKYHMEQTRPINMTQNAIHALRQAVEQAEKQEPHKEWVGLTDEEMSELYNKNYDLYDTDMTFMDFFMVQREVETKLKEKNT